MGHSKEATLLHFVILSILAADLYLPSRYKIPAVVGFYILTWMCNQQKQQLVKDYHMKLPINVLMFCAFDFRTGIEDLSVLTGSSRVLSQ